MKARDAALGKSAFLKGREGETGGWGGSLGSKKALPHPWFPNQKQLLLILASSLLLRLVSAATFLSEATLKRQTLLATV